MHDKRVAHIFTRCVRIVKAIGFSGRIRSRCPKLLVSPRLWETNPEGVHLRHYELLLLIHPDQGNQAGVIANRYAEMITDAGGTVHRHEDWGRRSLAYRIEKAQKAHYVLLNIESDLQTVQQMRESIKLNTAIMRHLLIRCDRAETEPSPILQATQQANTTDRARSGKARRDNQNGDAAEGAAEKGAQEKQKEVPMATENSNN